MKGKILGFDADAGTGVITGEDGARHKFSRTEWRGDRPPVVNMAVDFESAGGEAKDIYPVGGKGLGGIDLSGISASLGSGSGGAGAASLAEHLKSQLTTTLAFPLALIVLLAFFLPALSTPTESPNQFGLGKHAQAVRLQMSDTDIAARTVELDRVLADIDQDLARQSTRGNNNVFGMDFSAYDARYLQERKAQVQEERNTLAEAGGSIGLLKFTIGIFMLRFGALLGALALIWVSWTAARPIPPMSLVTGALSLISAALILAFESGLTAAMRVGEVVNLLAATQIDAAISVGIGTWLLIAAGLALIASGLGLIRNPLALH